jgi:hypothetical protein
MLSPLRRRAGKRLREPFGKAGLTVAVIALVFAMLGGAYAAGGLTSKQKKEVKAIAKGLQGTGPAGPQGAAGANGKDGANGSNGTNGSNGADGKTILSGAATPTSEGVNGDFYVKTGSSPEIFGPKTGAGWGSGTKLKGANGSNGTNGTAVLNGAVTPTTEGEEGDFYIDTATNEIFGPKTGAGWGSGTSMKGPEGNIKATLPVGTTMKGTWSAGSYPATAAAEVVPGPISFNIPISEALLPTVYLVREGESESPLIPAGGPLPAYHKCEGGSATPTVGNLESGQATLCIFTTKSVNWKVGRSESSFILTGSKNGSPNRRLGEILLGESEGAGVSYAYGTWAVKIIP